LPKQRKTSVIPSRFISDNDANSILNFCLELINKVGDYCCSVKPNTQYFLGRTNILKEIVKEIHKEGMLAILDHKLSDIGSTNESAIFWISEMGFDAFTYSPFPGNIKETVVKSHERGLAVIVLTLMSNPEAENLMVNSRLDDSPFYLGIAKRVADADADGCVIGLTDFVKDKYIQNIQEAVSDKVIFLMQGVGPQGGAINKVKIAKNPLVSVGREVIFSEHPEERAQEFQKILQNLAR